jgi:hypothetical protein
VRTEPAARARSDRTETFTELHFWPQITVRPDAGSDAASTARRVHKALAAAQKYSLVANSVKSQIVVEPRITVEAGSPGSG